MQWELYVQSPDVAASEIKIKWRPINKIRQKSGRKVITEKLRKSLRTHELVPNYLLYRSTTIVSEIKVNLTFPAKVRTPVRLITVERQ